MSGRRRQHKEGDNVKFTVSKDGMFTYAIVNAEKGSQITLSSVKPAKGSKINMLGVKSPMKWKEVDGKLIVNLPLKMLSE